MPLVLRVASLPTLCIALALFALPHIPAWSQAYQPLWLQLPLLLLGLVVLLAAKFMQARLCYTALLLALSYVLIQWTLQVPLTDYPPLLRFSLLSLGLPLLLGLYACLPESGLLNLRALAFVLPPLLLLAAYLLGLYQPQHWAPLLITELAIRPYPWSVASLPALLLTLAVIALLSYRLWRQPDAVEAALWATGVSTALVLIRFDTPMVSTTLFSINGLLLAIAVLSRSHDMAYRDELTRLPGRRALMDAFKSPGRNYVIAMMDVDHFKKFNDTHGHDVGDDVLRMVAAKIAQVSGGGKAFRYGGEEFTILFRNKTPQACIPHLQAVRETIAHYDLVLRNTEQRPADAKQGKQQRGQRQPNNSVRVTISIGIACKDAERRDPISVMKAADQALYRAKQAGRNCLQE